jgi:hypothetical protein
VLGLLDAHERSPATTVADAMTAGVVTVRPHLSPADVPDAARKQGRFLVTTSDGVLVGLVRDADLEALRGLEAA